VIASGSQLPFLHVFISNKTDDARLVVDWDNAVEEYANCHGFTSSRGQTFSTVFYIFILN